MYGTMHQVRHKCDDQVLHGLRVARADDDCTVLWMRHGDGSRPEVLHAVWPGHGGRSGLQLWSGTSAWCKVLQGLRQACSIGLFPVRSRAVTGR